MRIFDQLQFFKLDEGTFAAAFKDKVVYTVLDFKGMKPENNWQMNYNLEVSTISNTDLDTLYRHGKGTKKIPLELKNMFREKLGLKPVKASKWSK